MTKSLTPGMTTHLAGEVTTLCTCWHLIREDGVEMGFTDHDKDLTIDTLLYKAATGFTASAVQSKSDFSVDNVDIDGIISDNDIEEPDILNGKYDYAEVEVFMVNYENLAHGKLYLKRGRLGEVRIKRSKFIAEFRGLSQHLTQHIGRVYSSSCDAILGDSRCAVNLAAFTFSDTISEVTDRQKFKSIGLTQDAGYFTGGEIEFTSGANDGLKMEVKDFANTEVILALPMPNDIEVGDGFTIKTGCDKTDGTCKNKFSNLVNFRGFATIPGMDKILETAGTAADFAEG